MGSEDIEVTIDGQDFKINEKDRSVNLALETVLEFNHKDNSADIQFLDNVQKFITKVKGVIDKNKVSRRDFRSGKTENFTDFIQDVISIVNTYDDPDFQDVFDILDDEIRKYHYRGCKFYELTENYEIRKVMGSKLDLIRGQPVPVVRSFVTALAKVLKEEKYDRYVKDLMDYINSIYRQDAADKFNKVLNNLEEFHKSKSKKSVDDLVKIIREAVRSIIFDHYTDLNPNARRELKSRIEVFLKQHKQAPYTKSYSTKETFNNDKKNENAYSDTKFVESGKKVEPNTLKVLTKKEEASHLDRDDIFMDEKEEQEEMKETKGREGKKKEEKEVEKEIEEELEKDESELEDTRSDDLNNYSERVHEKKISNMRDGMKEENNDSYEKNRAWIPRYTKLDTNLVDTPDDMDVKPKKVPRSYQRTTKRHYRNGRTFSTDEMISEDVGTVEDNSIEFHAEELTSRQRSITSELPRFVTLWEETATGGIPQYMLNQLAKKQHKSHKKKHKSKHKEHKKHKSKKHKSHEKHKKHKKHKDSESYHKTKLRSKKKKDSVIFSEHNADISVRSTTMEYYEYKKMLEPAKIARMPMENNDAYIQVPFARGSQKNARPSDTSWPDGYIQVPSPRVLKNLRPDFTKTPSKTLINTTSSKKSGTKKYNRRNITPSPKYGKRYQMLSVSPPRVFRKSGLLVQGSLEGKSSEQSRHKDRKTRNSYNATETVVVDVNVIKRLKDLEREIKEVKSKMGDKNTDKVWNDKEKKYEAKDKRRSRLVKNSSPEQKKAKHKTIPDKAIEYKAEIKVISIAPVTSLKTTEKYEMTAKETRSTDNPIIVIQRKTDSPERILVKNDKRHDEGTMRLVNEDRPNPVPNYDEVDEWKDAFKINSKILLLKTTTKSTATTTTTTTTSTMTTPKHTETVPTSAKVEIFIPVSMPSSKTTTPKPMTTEKDRPKQDIHIPFVETFNMKTPNSLTPMLVSPFAASNVFNFSNSINARENIQNEVSFILKKNNISVPTDKPDYNNLASNYNDMSLPFNRMRKELAFTPAMDDFDISNNTLAAGLLFTDPFRNIDDELEFLKV